MKSNATDQSIYQYLDLSTSHISKETMDLLTTGTKYLGITIATYEYGAFISVPDFTEHFPADLPEDLKSILMHANDLGCFVVRLDSDGNLANGLLVYDW